MRAAPACGGRHGGKFKGKELASALRMVGAAGLDRGCNENAALVLCN